MIYARGYLIDAQYLGSSSVVSYTLEEDGRKCEVLSMEPIGEAGEYVEIEINFQVRKNKAGVLQDSVSVWPRRNGRGGRDARPVPGFEKNAHAIPAELSINHKEKVG